MRCSRLCNPRRTPDKIHEAAGCAGYGDRQAQSLAGGSAAHAPDHRCSRGDLGDVRQRQRLDALVLPSDTALIGGTGLFGVIHVIYFTYCFA
jgi:hypothetical protein